MSFDFKGSVAVVTGAASGIGRASAIEFAKQGSAVVVSDIDEVRGREVVGEIEALGVDGLWIKCDVAQRGEVEALARGAIDWKGHCDLFMSNAGIGIGGAPHVVPVEEWERVLAINLHSHIWAVREVLPHMLERGSGHLVHTASSAGTLGFPMLIPYCVTKFGVVGLCESLAGYVRDRGVGVSVVCPLVVSTNIFERSWNYPEEATATQDDERLQEMVRQFFRDSGLPPSAVATDIAEAVKGNRFYVFPHPELKDMIDTKWRDPDAWVAAQAASWQMQQQAAAQIAASD